MKLRFEPYQGAAISAVFEPLARLRIAVFREFPYLYEGSLAYEKEYLRTYANAERALLYAVFDQEQLVGATTGIPLSDETEDVQAPFRAAGFALDSVFYFGESMLLPQYRGLGLGKRFFDVREAHAAQFEQYKFTCFCAVERPPDHPQRPPDYRPLDAFWAKRGYAKTPALRTEFAWPDLGESASTPKTMTFWTRPLP